MSRQIEKEKARSERPGSRFVEAVFRQCLAQCPRDDCRHLAPQVELVPPSVDRRDALAGVREQRGPTGDVANGF